MTRHGAWTYALLFVSVEAHTLPGPACAMTQQELSWIDSSLGAWRYMASKRLKIPLSDPPSVIVFDGKRRFEAKATANPRWFGDWASKYCANLSHDTRRLAKGAAVDK
jgi:hypothetical protein